MCRQQSGLRMKVSLASKGGGNAPLTLVRLGMPGELQVVPHIHFHRCVVMIAVHGRVAGGASGPWKEQGRKEASSAVR